MDVRSSMGRIARSVAVYASERVGNVASEFIEPWDVCRGCGLWFTDGAGTGPGVTWGGRVPLPGGH